MYMLRHITGQYCVIFSVEMQPFSELKKDQTRTVCQDNTGPATTGMSHFSPLCFICASWHHTLTQEQMEFSLQGGLQICHGVCIVVRGLSSYHLVHLSDWWCVLGDGLHFMKPINFVWVLRKTILYCDFCKSQLTWATTCLYSKDS